MNKFQDIFKPIGRDEQILRYFPLKKDRIEPYTEEVKVALKTLIDCFNCSAYKYYYDQGANNLCIDYHIITACMGCKKKHQLLTDIQISCIKENAIGRVLPPIFYTL